MSRMPPLTANQMAVVTHGSPIPLLDDIPYPSIVMAEYDTMSYESRRMLPPGTPPSIAGYCEIFLVRDSGKWFAYHEDSGGSSRSVGYDTEIEALHYLHAQLSQAHAYWRLRVRHAETDLDDAGRQIIRCNGTHYTVGTEPAQGRSRDGLGFGGHRWHFRMSDGREIITHNLWHQGSIPIEYRDQLPDNATLVPNPLRGAL